jgi:hypothetical protein
MAPNLNPEIFNYGLGTLQKPTFSFLKLNQNKGSKHKNLGSIEYHHALFWKIDILAGLGSRPQAQIIIVT